MYDVYMIRIYQALDLPQAQLIIDLLARNNISALLLNGNAQSAMGDIPFTHAYPEIWIKNETQREQAKQLIGEFEKPIGDEQWQCRSCEEQSPSTFDSCWNCLKPRVADGVT